MQLKKAKYCTGLSLIILNLKKMNFYRYFKIEKKKVISKDLKRKKIIQNHNFKL